MYKLLLTFKYLRRRLIPIFALLSVMLCCAMVITIMGVMGGVLDALRQSTRVFIGDSLIWTGSTPLPHYQQLVDEITAHPDAIAATPLIYTVGLVKTPEGSTKTLKAYGIEPHSFAQVTQYDQTLYWTPDRLAQHKLTEAYPSADPTQAALNLTLPDADNNPQPAMVLGIDINPGNEHLSSGAYLHPQPAVGETLTLTILSSTQWGADPTPETRQLIVANEFNSGLYEFDSHYVFAPFTVIQKMMKMNARPATDDLPAALASTQEIHVKAAPGVSPEELSRTIEKIYREVAAQHAATQNPLPINYGVYTWAQSNSRFLDNIEGQKRLVTTLFAAVSGVAVLLILVMFYMIVMEKTRDIGILRSLGASRMGVAGIYLAFGAAIGLIGAALGITLGLALVYNINTVHDLLGSLFGFQIWDRTIYFYHDIPARILPAEAIATALIATLASTAGAILPAIKAARVDPIQSLRYE